MSKCRVSLLVASLFVVLSGCGGESRTGGPNQLGGIALSEYRATLPDGSPMEIEILANDDLAWMGEFAVAAETGPYAHQVGSFEGKISGNQVTATCEPADGPSFELAGTADSTGLHLTRSDIPGTVLHFQQVTPMAVAARADASFTLSTGGPTGSPGSSGRATISTTPFSTQSTMTEYRGTWLGLNITFWSYSSGYAAIITYCNDYAVNSANFVSYRLADIPTKTVSSSSGRLSVYSPVTRTQVQYPNVTNVSP